MEDKNSLPFGMSRFQIEKLAAIKETPHRTVRNCQLQIRQKKEALAACHFRQKRRDIDKREKKSLLDKSFGFEKERLIVDILEIDYKIEMEKKMIYDCLEELKIYQEILSKLPKFTVEEFEEQELLYWKTRFINDAKRELLSSGTITAETIRSLDQIGIETSRNKENKLTLSGSASLIKSLNEK